jgi:ABC-2 type transport system ATP-binding protein
LRGATITDDVIVVKDLRKVFEPDIVAVDGISFRVHAGEVFGFLGPNGAGKSTTIKILTTLLAKTSGAATISGFDVDKDQNNVRRIIGYASQDVGVDDDLTGRENLMLQCQFHHMSKERAVDKVESLLKTVKLTEAGDRRLSTYSGGMRKRLDLASALVSDPKVLFLDEPTTGLDPQSRQDIWEYIKKLNANGMTIFLTTQYMEEADRLANRLCIVDQGQIVAEGTPKNLKGEIGADVINMRFKSGDPSACMKASEALKGLKGIREVGTCPGSLTADEGLTVLAQNGASLVPQLVKAVDAAGVSIEQLTVSAPTLDEVFLKLTGKTLNVIERKENVKSQGFGARRRER